MFESKLRYIGLQFFAEGGEGGGDEGGDEGGGGKPGDEGGGGTKTFTQEEVTRMMATEKRQGRTAVLTELGIDPKDKEAVKRVQELIKNQKTAEQLKDEAVKAAEADKSAAVSRAEAAERKIAVLTAGCGKEYIDEVTTLAAAKVTEDVPFEKALEEVKKKFPTFFGGDEGGGDSGTGKGQGHKKQSGDNKPGGLGSRLAQAQKPTVKNPYFKS